MIFKNKYIDYFSNNRLKNDLDEYYENMQFIQRFGFQQNFDRYNVNFKFKNLR